MENAKKVSKDKRRNKTLMYNKLNLLGGGGGLRLKGTHPYCTILHCPCEGNTEKFYGPGEPWELNFKDRPVAVFQLSLRKFDSRVSPSEGDYSGLRVHNY